MYLFWIFSKYRWAYLLLVAVLSYIGYLLFLQNIFYPILLGAALFPGIVYVAIVRYSDVGHREPRGVVALHMLLGILLIFPAIYLEDKGIQILLNLGYTPFLQYDLISVLFWIFFATLVVAPIEEFLKYFGSLAGNFFHRENDEASDAIVYSVAIAAGFALYENYRYVFSALGSYSYTDALTLAIARSLTAIPLHLGAGLVMGYYLAGFYHPEKFGIKDENKKRYLVKGLIYPILIHAMYDILVFLIFFNFIIQVIIAVTYVSVMTYMIWKRVINLRNKGQYAFVETEE